MLNRQTCLAWRIRRRAQRYGLIKFRLKDNGIKSEEQYEMDNINRNRNTNIERESRQRIDWMKRISSSET